jgi:archaellum component FlaD/FlaE
MDADARTKPYLEQLPAAADETTLSLRWSHYLGDTFGASGALAALRYYEQVGWISRQVRSRMADHLQGLSMEEIHTKKYEEPVTLDAPLDGLNGSPFAAHAKSLAYIAALAGDDLSEALLFSQLADRRIAPGDD